VEKFIELNKSSKHTIKSNKSNAIMIALLLIGLVVVFSYSMGNVAAAPTTVYVNVTSGNDAYDGSSAAHTTGTHGPVADLSTGIKDVNASGTVKVASGLYTGSKNYGITINKNLNINGQSKTTTTINAAGNSWILYNPGHTVKISNLTFRQGKSTGVGSAVDNVGGTLTVTNCNFNSNTATGNGGALGNTGSLVVKNCNFNGNTATVGGGGAIYNSVSSAVVVQGSIFTSNSASVNGGAINNDLGQKITVTDCNFNSNTATGNGGAIDSEHTLIVNGNSIFTGNSAIGSGGAIGFITTLNLDSSTFTSNHASFGGAIYNGGGTLTLTRSHLNGNSATNSGGAIYNGGTSTTISGSNLISNTATWGSAIFSVNSLTVSNTNLNYNSANNFGGAIDNGGTLIFTNNNINYNTANDGGAIYNTGSANIQFNRIFANSATLGKAIYNTGTIVSLANNWWGSNNGPAGVNYGTIVTLWLISKLSANTTMPNNSHTSITVNFNYNNLGNPVVGYLTDGIPVKFTTTLGTITQASTVNGVAISTLTSGSTAGVATIYTYLDNQKLNTTVTIKDTIPPKVISTNPANGQKGFSKTGTLAIKFSEKIKSSIKFNSIKVKNMKTGKYVSITKSIVGNTINIKTTKKRTGNDWYEIIIPAAAIKDMAGNNLAATYICKFQSKK